MERQLCRLILSLVILYYIVCTYHFRQYLTFENEAQMRLQNNVLMHCKLRRRIASHQISMRLRTSSQPQVCPRPAMLHCKLSTNTSSSHTAQWLRQLVYSKNAQFFLQLGLFEVRSRSHYKRTAPGFVWKCTETTSSRRYRYTCLVRFWCAPECDCYILICPNQPHQEGNRTMRFNRTKWGRCESTLRGPNS